MFERHIICDFFIFIECMYVQTKDNGLWNSKTFFLLLLTRQQNMHIICHICLMHTVHYIHLLYISFFFLSKKEAFHSSHNGWRLACVMNFICNGLICEIGVRLKNAHTDRKEKNEQRRKKNTKPLTEPQKHWVISNNTMVDGYQHVLWYILKRKATRNEREKKKN